MDQEEFLSVSSNSATEKEPEAETDIMKAERMRYQYYAFLRRSRKPLVGEEKVICFPKVEEKEDLKDYFDRCHKETGAKPAPIIPNQKKGK